MHLGQVLIRKGVRRLLILWLPMSSTIADSQSLTNPQHTACSGAMFHAGKMVIPSRASAAEEVLMARHKTTLDNRMLVFRRKFASSQSRNQDEWRSLFIKAARRGQS